MLSAIAARNHCCSVKSQIARPKKNEGGATTPVTTATSSAPNTTPAEGVSTAPEALVAEPTQLDDTTTVTPAESAVVETSLPLEGGTADPTEAPVVPPSQREDGTNLAPIAAVEAPAVPVEAQPRKLSAEQVALGIPEHYIRCRIKGLGSISGHGLTEEGKPHENHVGGSVAYFSIATVKKLADLLTILDES